MFNLLRRRSRCIGVDINDTHILCVELSYHSRNYRLENYAIFARQSDWEVQWASMHFTSKKIITAVANAQVITHKISLSKSLSPKEKNAFLALEMEKIALLPLKELYITTTKIAQSNDLIDYSCATVRQETIHNLLTPFKNIGLQVHAVDLSEKALERAQYYSGSNALIIPDNQHSAEWITQWKKDEPQLTTAIGLAMHPNDAHAFNFLSQTKKKSIIPSWGIYCLIGLFFIGSFLLWLKSNPVASQPLPTPHIIKKQPIKKALPIAEFQQVPLYRLKYAGFLDNTQHRIGLIKTPDGHIYYVFIGNKLGKEKATIIKLTDKSIIVTLHHKRITIE